MTSTVGCLFRNYVGLKKGFVILFNMKYMENNRTDFSTWKMEFGNHFEKKQKEKKNDCPGAQRLDPYFNRE